jgi:hypothetical protein
VGEVESGKWEGSGEGVCTDIKMHGEAAGRRV